MHRTLFGILAAGILVACGDSTQDVPATPASSIRDTTASNLEGLVAYSGATIWDGTGALHEGKSLVVRDGRIVALSDSAPRGADVIDLGGAWIVPGIVNAHGHVSGRWAPSEISDAGARVRGDLELYARYGVTTVVSLGGAGPEAFTVRDAQATTALRHARVRLAGSVVAGDTVADAVDMAQTNVGNGVDWIKFRIDDNLGTGTKMSRDAVAATMRIASDANLPIAAHIFYLEDAIHVSDRGVTLVAHSVRDQAVDEAFFASMRTSGACYVPTLTREVSTFVYAQRPDFFGDPFFLEAALPGEMQRVSDPAFMERVAASPAAAGYKVALEQATANLKAVSDAGIPVAFGTDSGPGGRFPGYFEHMEMKLMADAGLTPAQIWLSATATAAACAGLDDVGTLQVGKWADFIVLHENPLRDVRASRSIKDVYIAGNRVARN